MSFYLALSTILVALALFVISYYKWTFNYWKRKGVPHIPATIPFGNLENPFNTIKGPNYTCWEFFDKLKSNRQKCGGLFLMLTPIFVPADLDLIKSILVKDFNHFTSRGFVIDEKNDPIGAHLFTLNEPQWKKTRVKLTPTFTSGKMKMMFGTVLKCGNELKSYVKNSCEKTVDIKEVCACFTTDVIGSCAFGIECNSFKNPDAEFRKNGRRLLEPNANFMLRRFFFNIIPYINKIFKVPLVPRDITTFFMEAFGSVLGHRETTNVRRDDFVQILMDMRQKAREEGLVDPLTFEQMAAQAFVFYLAGFETSSSTMTFCLHELAFNQEIQDKLRNEINSVMEKDNDKLTYNNLTEMKYLSQVIDETLRKYPPLAIIPRECTEDYKIPGGDILIEKGTKIWICALAIQRNAEFYPNPEKFDPERFSEENKANRHPCAYLPFGEGPRICIGIRFGLMQAKIGLAVLLKNFKFSPSANTNYNIKFNPKSSVLVAQDTILLDVQKL